MSIETVISVVTLAAGVYEVASRVIPTSKTWSIIGIVLNAAKGISDALDKKKVTNN